jgi:U3 small nucleolar RNA-associated protein 20
MAISKGKVAKPTTVVKPKKDTKRTTTTTKNHRWQPFSQRIANLRIDPIRRKRAQVDSEALSEETDTYFGRSLTEWRDLNLSETFASFAKEAAPLCDNLPSVLYNEEKIMDLLAEYIAKADALAMEALLSLLSRFAHDMDTRFEKHFARAVSTVASVASKHPDPAVVEWSFTCLAWLFKYLSRLLTPDLRPVYDLMSIYMGKESQKPFIVRFAAESMSFLVRKAATTYDRDPQPLDRILSHILEDCIASESIKSASLHRQGVMTLVTEAVKGIQHGIHTNGLAVMKSLLKLVRQSPSSSSIEIVIGSLTSIIHYTTPQTFQPVAKVVVDELEVTDDNVNDSIASFASQTIFAIVSVRKAGRIEEWTGIVKIVSTLVKAGTKQPLFTPETKSQVLSALAVIMQSATIESILPALGLLDMTRTEEWLPHFLSFCDVFARLGDERYQQFLVPHLQKFVITHWKHDPTTLLQHLPRLAASGPDFKMQCPKEMQQYVLQQLELLDTSDVATISAEQIASANLALNTSRILKLESQNEKRMQQILARLVKSGLEASKDSANTLLTDFCLGNALFAAVSISAPVASLWPLLCSHSTHAFGLPPFCFSMLKLIKSEEDLDVSGEHIEPLIDTLVRSLALPSHPLRSDSLDILEAIYKRRNQDVPETLSIAILIESTPLNIETMRSVSMNIRRLATAYKSVGSDTVMEKAMPTFCFGLLHVRLSQAWNDAIEAMSSMCQTQIGEETIVALTQAWLEGQKTTEELDGAYSQPITLDSEQAHIASDFECSNLAVVDAIATQAFEEPYGGYPAPEQAFRLHHQRLSPNTATSRSQALKVLDRCPHLAEKRSRLLIPILLQWAGTVGDENQTSDTERWARKDQKAMLAVVAKFNNPRVLYRASEVHDALLNLCANGDVEIQTSALKAIMAWKEPALRRSEEHLNNFLDDARFREEISVFLQGEGDEALKPADHAAVMPVLLRLLYGRAVGSAKDNQNARRKAIFVALSRFEPQVLGAFIDIAIAKTQKDGEAVSATDFAMPLRQQVGMLNMINDMLETLGSGLEPYAIQLADTALLCTVSAGEKLEIEDKDDIQDASLLRAIRQTGLQSLVKIFADNENLDLSSQGKTTVAKLISPRMTNFAVENLQGVSAMLKMCSAWSKSATHCKHLFQDPRVLNGLAELLGHSGSQNEVKIFILRDVLDKLVLNAAVKEPFQPYVSAFVASISKILSSQHPAGDLLSICVKSTTKLAERITDPKQAEEVIQVCANLLRQPGNFVHPSVKAGLVRTMMPLLDTMGDTTPPRTVYESISGLFSRLRDLESRKMFSQALVKLCKGDEALLESADICEEINALDPSRLNEPDHDRKEQGFTRIYENAEKFTTDQWLPLMHNCMLFIRDEDDTVNRSSAARALELLIVASSKTGNLDLIKSDLFPAVQRGMREPSELVRAEYLRLLGRMVECCTEWTEINDMAALSVEGDEEASFFTNVLHIQQHRRLRALRRLAEEPKLKSQNVSRIFLPLLEQFIFDQAEGDAGRTLSDTTVITIGSLAKNLKWSDYRSVMKRYFGQLKKNPDQEKVVLRLISALVDGLTARMNNQQDTAMTTEEQEVSRTNRQKVIMDEFLPPLSEYLHRKDESTVDRRVTVAVSITKLLRLLPENEFINRLAPTLTDISHILRSRDLEAREQTRRTFSTILRLVGPTYLNFVLKELRSALQRGYQLHVLSYTVHYLLVTNADQFSPGDLDACLSEFMAVVMDDIFGVTGQEKEAEEYTASMKEIKSSKSYDTTEILARSASITHLGQLMLPIRTMLSERLDSKMVKKIDELLVRVRKGVDQNPASDSRDMLVFCHEMVRQVYAQEAMPATANAPTDYRKAKFLIASEQKANRKGATTSYLFKLSSFALNLVRKVVRRHEDLQTAANMAGYLPIIGDAIVGGQEEVKIAAAKLVTTIIRVPLPAIEANSPVYLKEAVNMIKSSTSSTTDSAKAGLDLVTAILREKRSVKVKETDIAILLKTLKTDLDEPDRQGILFRFLRAVIGRKIIITEVYEVMDEVARMMITNPDASVRQSARSAYVQFVLDYPQGKDRWTKTTGFLIKNLDYEHVAGRHSVMEVLHTLLTKVGDEILQPLLLTFFVGLIPRLSSDTDRSCRDMAGVLIGKVYESADNEREKTLRETVKKWMGAEKKIAIRKAALQCWAIFVRSSKPADKIVDGLMDELAGILATEIDLESVGERQHLIAALDLFTAICEMHPERAFAKKRITLWSSVQERSTAPVPEAQEAAAKLQGMLFNDTASSSSKTDRGLAALPLRASGGLELGAQELRSACVTNMRVLRSSSANANEAVAQTARNIVFLGRAFSANGMQWKETEASEEAEEEDDDVEEEDKANGQDTTAIGYLLSRLSAIVRRENTPAATRTAALQCQTALLNHLSAPLPNIATLIRPLYNLTDPSVPQPPGEAYVALSSLARETLDLLQKKLGSEAYVAEMGKAKKASMEKRDERRRKRRIEAVSEPEKWAKEKKKKFDAKKARIKEKGAEERGKRRGW